jgi:hypothetical protein
MLPVSKPHFLTLGVDINGALLSAIGAEAAPVCAIGSVGPQLGGGDNLQKYVQKGRPQR